MENTILIGWGKRSLAMEGPVPITGQFYLRVSLGTYNDVIASALALDNGADSVIFVSADLVSIPPELLKETVALLKKESPEIPAEKIILNATHTHAGPSGVAGGAHGEYPRVVEVTPPEEVIAFQARQVADAVKEAWSSRKKGSIAYGYGFAVTGHSRRVVYSDDIGLRDGGVPGLAVNGHAKMYGNTNDPMFEGYECGLDPFINILYTFDEAGKVNGAVINVPCPSQTGENAWMYHASFWHNVREKLCAKYGPIGVVAQAAAAGDLSPRQLHYKLAEERRYRLKYPHLRKMIEEKPFRHPKAGCANEWEEIFSEYDLLEYCRAEDIASRICEAFDEVLSWASKEKLEYAELTHRVETLSLPLRVFPEEMAREEEKNYEELMKKEFLTDGDPWEQLKHNSILSSQRTRCCNVGMRTAKQKENPLAEVLVHVVKIGNIAFATNPFELYMSFMHRMQARSPFEQTFVVQLTAAEPEGIRGYLATERALANKGYSASPYCNQISPEGGQVLVDETLKILEELKQ